MKKKRHILTICMWYFENLYWLWFIHFLRITSVRLPWHSSLQVQKCPEMFVVGSIVKCKFNFFFHFKSGKPIVVIILSLIMLFYIYNRVFFSLVVTANFLCILTWGYYDAIYDFFFSFFMDKNIFYIISSFSKPLMISRFLLHLSVHV